MALNGSAVLISVNTGTTESPEFTVIPCQTTGEYSLSIEERDTSCKDSDDNRSEPGARSRTMSVETLPGEWPELVENPASAEQHIRHAAETGVQIAGRVLVSGDAKEQFTATITSYSLSAGRAESVTCSLELAISGPMTPVSDES